MLKNVIFCEGKNENRVAYLFRSDRLDFVLEIGF